MRMNSIFPILTIIAASTIVLSAAPAFAEMVAYKADLKSSTEVPANDSKGTGMLDATLDTATKKLSWTVTYSGLTGAVTAAHFHGPADMTATAPPVVPLSGSFTSPIKGDVILTEGQTTDLVGGKMYFNVHTAAHKDGELRGQVVKK